MSRITPRQRALDRARQDVHWGHLARTFLADPRTVAMIGDACARGLSDPDGAWADMERPERLMVFTLAHLAVAEAMLKATDPDLERRR